MKIDLSNAPTVIEHVKESHYTKLWLCPSLVSDGRIGRDAIFSGLECTPSNIPKKIQDKKVRLTFNEAKTHCIIWENDEDTSFLNICGLLGESTLYSSDC